MTRSRMLLSVVLGLGMAGAMAYPTLAQDAPPPPPPGWRRTEVAVVRAAGAAGGLTRSRCASGWTSA